MVEVRVGDSPLAMLEPDPPADPVGIRLLGPFDPYLLGYRTRDLVVDPAYRKHINAGGGMVSPVVLSNGRAIGTWRPNPKPPAITLFPPTTNRTTDQPIATELTDLTRFST